MDLGPRRKLAEWCMGIGGMKRKILWRIQESQAPTYQNVKLSFNCPIASAERYWVRTTPRLFCPHWSTWPAVRIVAAHVIHDTNKDAWRWWGSSRRFDDVIFDPPWWNEGKSVDDNEEEGVSWDLNWDSLWGHSGVENCAVGIWVVVEETTLDLCLFSR